MFKAIHNYIFKLITCTILCLCIVFTSFFANVNIAYAFDLAVTPTIAVIATALVSAGVISTNSSDLISAANSFNDWIKDNDTFKIALHDISRLGTGWTALSDMHITGAIMDAIGSWVADLGYIDGAISVDVPTYSGAITFNGDISTLNVNFKQVIVDKPFITFTSFDNISSDLDNPTPFFNGTYIARVGNTLYWFYNKSVPKSDIGYTSRWQPNLPCSFYVNSSGFFCSTSAASTIGTSIYAYLYGISLGNSIITTTTATNTLTVNPNVIPKATGNAGTTVKTPEWTTTTSADGTKSVSLPESLTNTLPIPYTGTLSGSLTSTGEGTGIFSDIGKFLLDIPILGDILSFLQQILKAIMDGFISLASAIAQALTIAVDTVLNWFNGFGSWLKDLLTKIFDLFSKFFDFIKNAFKRLGGLLDDILLFSTKILSGLYNYATNIISWLLSYNLFTKLFNHFLPTPIANVMITFFLSSLSIRLFRFILNR